MLLRPENRDLVRYGEFVAWWTRRFDFFDSRLTILSAQRTQAAVRIGMRGPFGLLDLRLLNLSIMREGREPGATAEVRGQRSDVGGGR
jgi:hypothetical protein